MIQGLTLSQSQALTALNVSVSALSFLGSAFIVICFLCFKELRKFSFQLVFWLSISDLMTSIFSFMGDPHGGVLCHIQGYGTQFFAVASFLWTTTIAFTLHRTVVKKKIDTEDMGRSFHLYVWGTATLATLLPMVADDYGETGAWCWVRNETTVGKVLRFVSFYVFLWGAIIYNGVTYYQVTTILNNTIKMASLSMAPTRQRRENDRGIRAMQRLVYYPLILIGCWAFGTINRVQNFLQPHRPLFWLYVLHIGTASLMGFCNFIAYGLNASVRRVLYERWLLIWPDRWRLSSVEEVNGHDLEAEEMLPLQTSQT